jgi:hypothetical protein
MNSGSRKIGILTFHEVFNPGAFLQAYASQCLLEELGYHPEIIHYTTPSFTYSTRRQVWLFKRTLHRHYWMLRDNFLKDLAFKRSRRKYLKLSKRLRAPRDIERTSYEAVLVGADIVWNFELRKDPVYFGHHLPTKNLISFAASCGDCDWRKEMPDYVRTGIAGFKHLSARDASTRDLVETTTGRKCPILCDPAFHMNVEPVRNARDNIILVYVMGEVASPEFISSILRLRKRTGLPVHAIFYRHEWADRNIMHATPFAWAESIRRARFVITNTFHGTVFSVLSGTPFMLEYNSKNRHKTTGVIEACRLEARVFNGNNERDCFEEPFQQSPVAAFLKSQREASRTFLKAALQNC